MSVVIPRLENPAVRERCLQRSVTVRHRVVEPRPDTRAWEIEARTPEVRMLGGRRDDALVVLDGSPGVIVRAAGVRSDEIGFSRLADGGVRKHVKKQT